jgi:hypothetical protein
MSPTSILGLSGATVRLDLFEIGVRSSLAM